MLRTHADGSLLLYMSCVYHRMSVTRQLRTVPVM